MPTDGEASDSHTPYSPSHVFYSIEPLGPSPNSAHDRFAYSSSGSLPFPTVLQSAQPRGELLVHVEGSTLENNPDSPSYDPILPITQAGIEPESQNNNDLRDHVPYSPSFVVGSPSYIPAFSSRPNRANEPIVQEENSHVPYIPASTTTQVHNDCSRGSVPEVTVHGCLNRVTSQIRETSVQDGSLHQEFQLPEVPIRRWRQTNRRRWVPRFRSTIPHRVNPYLGAFSSERSILRNVTTSQRAIETNNGTPKTFSEGLIAEDPEDGMKEHPGGTGQFDCNICFDMAKEPVVTSCGHLFCWPCLYQWLHHHCDHKECPVCKGEVQESKITPIYGRGSSDMGIEKGHADGDSGFKVPPRPRGCRFESLRQHMRRPRPFSRRLEEEIGSWEHLVDEEIHDVNRVDGLWEVTLGGIDDDIAPFFPRYVAGQRFQRRANLENGLNLWGNRSSRSTTEMTLNNVQDGNLISDDHHGGRPRSTLPALAHGIDSLPQLSSYSVTSSDRMATIARDHSSMMRSNSNSGSHSDILLSAAHPRDYNNPMEAVFPADQTSDSSTVAVIRGDIGARIDDPTEPNSVGSSSSLRRRRNSTSGSLDVYGGFHHASKRRRLN